MNSNINTQTRMRIGIKDLSRPQPLIILPQTTIRIGILIISEERFLLLSTPNGAPRLAEATMA